MQGRGPQLGWMASVIVAAGVPAVAVLLGAPSWMVLALLVMGAVGLWAVVMVLQARFAERLEAVRSAAAGLEAERAALAGEARAELGADVSGALESARAVLVAEIERGRRELDVLSAVVGAVDEAILGADEDGALVVVNRAAETFVGVPASRLLGKGIDRAITYADVLRVFEAGRKGQASREAVRLVQAGGPRLMEVSAGPVRMSGGRVLTMLCLRDTTAEAQALKVRTEFVANASHELRTPIAAMRVAIDTLEAIDADDEVSRTRFVRIISSNIERLEELIRDLLDLSRAESADVQAELTHVEASQLVATLEPGFRRALEERSLRLEWELGPELEWMRTDRKLLLLILQNLIENAAKFAYSGTTIRVVGRAGPRVPPGVAGSGLRAAQFEVVDKGIGIPLDQQQRIFERFYQVDTARTGVGSTRRGTGLGLAIVKHAVKRLGGSVRVSSVWKQGTTMIVDLPGAVEERGASAA